MATRIHGQYARLLMSSTATGPFTMLASIQSVTLNRDTDRADTTSMGDANKTSVSGLGNADMDFVAFYDLDDTVLSAARAVSTGVMVSVYPNYVADKTKYYAVLGDVEWGYTTSMSDSQKVNGKVLARASAIDHL